MGFEYRGKALAAVSLISAAKADAVTTRLSQTSRADVSQLNSRLDMGWLRLTTRSVATIPGSGTEAQERSLAAELKRGVLLLQMLTGAQPAADFESARNVIRDCMMARSTDTGFDFKPSAWALACQTECNELSRSWHAAVNMAANGRITAGAALYSRDSFRCFCEDAYFAKLFG